jgi:hypothetical protein
MDEQRRMIMTARSKKRKRGGQPGNQNARKHGFYSRTLTSAQEGELAAATALKGIDREIGIARLKVKGVLTTDPDNTEVLARALSSLTGLLNAKRSLRRRGRVMSQNDWDSLLGFVSSSIPRNSPRPE